jgi:hypothetical protein
MAVKTETQDTLSDKLPADFAEQSQRIVNNAFRLLAEQTQKMTDDLAEFNRRRSETIERIRRGARRTTRRVI